MSRHTDIAPVVAVNSDGQHYEMTEAACTSKIRHDLKVHIAPAYCPRCFPMLYARFHRKHARVEPLPTLLDWARQKERKA